MWLSSGLKTFEFELGTLPFTFIFRLFILARGFIDRGLS